MSTPVPSPSMNGMMGWSETERVPSSAKVILSAMIASLPAPVVASAPGRGSDRDAHPLAADSPGLGAWFPAEFSHGGSVTP